ncbi:hypothetical protein AC481_02430 [miscellaneous Crenarchaeota group archaeon SMTZ-80]|nr:MAG: hypothetical protein AC481_02430 [miscellaneous Crenarchaeota group archaeon SMTZ-80]
MNKKIIGISLAIIIILAAAYLVNWSFYSYTGFQEQQYPTPQPAVRGPSYIASKEIAAGDAADFEERMVIYNAYISIETGDIGSTFEKVRNLAGKYGGYVAGSSRSTQGMQERAEIILRIPKDEFHSAIKEIESYGKLLDERTSSEDITERYVDLKARLSNLQKQEKRLNEILSMAKNVEEILQVERELTRIRGEIESLQGQINYLERNVETSSVVVNLIEPPPPFTPPGVDWGLTFETALMGFFGVIRGLIILIVTLLPLAIIGVPIYYLYRRREKTKKK